MTFRAIFFLLSAVLLGACREVTTGRPPGPAALEVVSGNNQQGTAGGALGEMLVVRVVDAQGRPLAGRTVSFAAAGGGTVTPASEQTGDEGQAGATWVLGASVADSQRVEARVGGGAGTELTVVFRARSRPGSVAALMAVGDTSFTGVLGADLPAPLRVRVTDALGNPVAGHNVVWQVRAGGGSLPQPTQTDAAGEATAAWRLGAEAGEPQRAEARSGGATVGFRAAGVPPADLVLETEGDGQSAPVGSAFPDALRLRARLADGRSVSGLPVEWSGAGLRAPVTTTDGQGRTENDWTATATGALTARATVQTAGGPRTVQWTGTGTEAPARELASVGNLPSTQTAGRPVRPDVRVRVTEAGRAVGGVTVRWVVTAGGGTLSADSTVTDAQGFATVEWTMGPPGPQGLRASVEGIADGLTFGIIAEAAPGQP
ncbi:Ig-like domain-containing protein [Longimicrobium sp.]|uniref:Ig-like domain-containing protein n=1 Tax=Longimicrobium sp. TaxID=2029185 RepID=UPI002E365D14|nr:Ig-like domain-containing protein [Longimicrobium sp.]HEX6038664.1 Ig-like domain-containing protein [Longimicrobium sp.]